ncbi:MAG TPA: hypothetical protein VNO81_13385 [Candidatus Nitrosotenuis sp.]|nr:hypothetical protein [Candidatus Nitrosotenuis sp.]
MLDALRSKLVSAAGTLLMCACLALPASAAVQGTEGGQSQTRVETHTQTVNIYYGTGISYYRGGGQLGRVDAVYPDKYISSDLAEQIARTYQDWRVDNITQFGTLSNYEFLTQTPGALNGSSLLYNAITSVPGRCWQSYDTGNQYRDTRTYNLTGWVQSELSSNAIVVGDGPDAHVASGTVTTVVHQGKATVNYYERNYTRIVSPLVLNLDGSGQLQASGGKWLPHRFVASSRTVLFDFHGNGFPVETEWVGPADGLLCVPKPDGTVDGTCLFGTTTGFGSGYEALAVRDKNGDMKITGAELSGLFVWQDGNGDAVAERSELFDVQDLGISEISLRHKNFKSTYVRNGKTYTMWDWWPSLHELRRRKQS